MNNNPESLAPQFNEPEIEIGQGRRDKFKNWFKNNSSIILAVVIILVLAGGIYAYTTRERISSPILEQNQEFLPTDHETQQLEIEEIPSGIGGPIIDIETDQETFTQTAQKGDGITHLARRALADYLEKTGENPELTKEHKIYIEDYLQNKTGEEMLKINDQKTFSKSLIEEAVQKSKTLTSDQLQKIAPFAKNVNL